MNGKKLTIEDYYRRMVEILKPESSFYIISIIYGIGVGILTLAIPISVQSLVNTVTFGVLNQPLIIISIVLFALLLFSGVLYALQTYIIELFQRHFYARTAADISTKILNANYDFFKKENGVELVNRYFDIMTVQKSVSSLLIGGISIVLQTIVGLLLLAFYHPYFLVFDVILIFFVWLVWHFYGHKAMNSSVYESKAKYETAAWLEEMSKNNLFFKNRTRKNQAIKTADSKILNYLKNRKEHFRFVFIQSILLLVIYAIMSSLLLGLGGFLVMQGQLTLGQLVAAELVVTVILASFSKSGKYLDTFYDLFAATDKINQLYDIKEMKTVRAPILEPHGYEVELKDVKQKQGSNEFLFDYRFKENFKYIITSDFHSTKLVFLDLLQCLIPPKSGTMLFGSNSFEDYNIFDLRENIIVIDQPSFIEGTIEDNLSYGRSLNSGQIGEVLDVVDLNHIDSTFEDSYNTKITSSGYPLWPSQLIRLEIAKAILQQPKVLVITEIFDRIEQTRRDRILKYLMKLDMTIILFTNKDCSEYEFNKKLIIDKTGIKEV